MSHSRQTEHYDLPLYDGGDIINPLTDFNNANEAIDTAIYNANQRSVQAENTAVEAKDIAEGYDSRVTQAIQTANDAMTLANNTQDMIAEEFDPMKQGGYQVGDFVIYNGVLYRFINAHTGAWDASDVQVSPVLIEAIGEVVDEGKQAIEEAVEEAKEEIAGQTEKVTKTQAMIAQPFDENKAGGYAVGDVVTYADKLYKFTSAHSGAWTGLDVEQVDVINGALEWKKFETPLSPTNIILPSANEYMFVVKYDETTSESIVTLLVPKLALNTNPSLISYIKGGSYKSNTNYNYFSLETTYNNGYRVRVKEILLNGSPASSATCELYYR